MKAIFQKPLYLPNLLLCWRKLFSQPVLLMSAFFKTMLHKITLVVNLRSRLRDWLSPLRQQLNQLEVRDAIVAHALCRLIPVQCPFARDIYLFGRAVAHIPPLCKLNPFYEEIVSLRFRALCYLADECGEDVRCYC